LDQNRSILSTFPALSTAHSLFIGSLLNIQALLFFFPPTDLSSQSSFVFALSFLVKNASRILVTFRFRLVSFATGNPCTLSVPGQFFFCPGSTLCPGSILCLTRVNSLSVPGQLSVSRVNSLSVPGQHEARVTRQITPVARQIHNSRATPHLSHDKSTVARQNTRPRHQPTESDLDRPIRPAGRLTRLGNPKESPFRSHRLARTTAVSEFCLASPLLPS
jgi:hypothetical protein